jgi:competence transcription factor ComK
MIEIYEDKQAKEFLKRVKKEVDRRFKILMKCKKLIIGNKNGTIEYIGLDKSIPILIIPNGFKS